MTNGTRILQPAYIRGLAVAADDRHHKRHTRSFDWSFGDLGMRAQEAHNEWWHARHDYFYDIYCTWNLSNAARRGDVTATVIFSQRKEQR